MSAMFDELWAIRLKPGIDNNRAAAAKAYDELLEVYSDEQIFSTYLRYKGDFLDSGKPDKYAKNLTKWLANPADPDCFKRMFGDMNTPGPKDKDKDKDYYRPSTFKISKGLVVDNCYLGPILLGWYQPDERDEWLGICTGEERGHPSWQPVPWKMADRYIAAGMVREADIEPVDWLDRRMGKTSEDVFQIVRLKGGAA
ncbi:MAG: hypothetical protein IKD70_09395 [Eggerthellaceae bacterium]|nr:hypothetical protein [Eggerthellaceae bacterium]